MRWFLLVLVVAGCSASARPAVVTPTPSPALSLDAVDEARFSLACDEVKIAANSNGYSATGRNAASSAAEGFSKLTDPVGQTLAQQTRAGDYAAVLKVCSG